jgi:serine/threonine protein kinase
MPYAAHGALETYAFGRTSNRRLTADQAQSVAAQVLTALRHIHARCLVHCDVKPANILVHAIANGLPQVWLCDFGLTKDATDAAKLTCVLGTDSYQAPEMFARKGITDKVDLWATGVTLHRTLTGLFPFRSRFDINDRTVESTFKSPVWNGQSQAGKNVVKQLLLIDFAKRPSAAAALMDPWLRSIAHDSEDECIDSDVPTELETGQSLSRCAM